MEDETRGTRHCLENRWNGVSRFGIETYFFRHLRMIMPFYLSFLAVFVALILVDICWTFYIAKVAERKAFSSAIWSVGIMICGAFATISYLNDLRLLVAAALGAFVGTFVAVKINKKESENS